MGVSKMLHVLILLLLTFAGGTWAAEKVPNSTPTEQEPNKPEADVLSDPWNNPILSKVAEVVLTSLLTNGLNEVWKNLNRESPWERKGVKCWGTKKERFEDCTFQKTCNFGNFTKHGWFFDSYCGYDQK